MPAFTIDPKRTALLAVDLQNCFVENSPVAAPQGPAIVARLNRLADGFRRAGGIVVWTRHAILPDHSDAGIVLTVPPVAGGMIDDGSFPAALHAAVDAQPVDIVLRKTNFGAFTATTLEPMLRARGIDTVVVGGIATNVCCETTAREAHAREFRVLFLSDGTATFGVPGYDGGLISGDEVQRVTLSTLAFLFAEVVSVDETLRRLSAAPAPATAPV